MIYRGSKVMSTNYYVDWQGTRLHIGKSSAGWEFLWQAYPELDIFTVKDWSDFLVSNKLESNIVDEYEGKISIIEFFNSVADNTHRNKKFGSMKWHKEETGDESAYADPEGATFIIKQFC